MSIAQYRKGENNSALLLAAENIASNIRETQTQSLTGIVEDEIIATGGFGIYFDTTSSDRYILFRDNGNQLYQDEENEDTVMLTEILPRNITITELFITDEDASPLTIVFKPPKPTIYLNASTDTALATIYVESDRISTKRGMVTIHQLTGRVTAELVEN